ncbi:MAG: ACP S-malonyltransferase, partial [Bradymonadaceae bacterium]
RPHHLNLAAADVEPPATDYRLAIAYRDDEELEKQVGRIQDAFDRGRGWTILANQGVYFSDDPERDGDIAMLFPGQGTQYLGMLMDLKEKFPTVARTYDEADEVMRPVLDGENLTDFIDPDEWDDEAHERLKQTEITQPAVLAADTALLKLLGKFGIEPDLVAGHSLGEYGALIAAEVMPLEEAFRTVARRGTAMAEAS